jgi:hypothetical protein
VDSEPDRLKRFNAYIIAVGGAPTLILSTYEVAVLIEHLLQL